MKIKISGAGSKDMYLIDLFEFFYKFAICNPIISFPA